MDLLTSLVNKFPNRLIWPTNAALAVAIIVLAVTGISGPPSICQKLKDQGAKTCEVHDAKVVYADNSVFLEVDGQVYQLQ